MSVITSQFNYELNQNSPVIGDVERIVEYDENGTEKVTFRKVDYPSITKSLGVSSDWSLKSLLAAGVNPNFPIHTGSVSRLENASEIESVAVDVENFFNESKNVENNG